MAEVTLAAVIAVAAPGESPDEPASPRRVYYNPMLDPLCQAKMTPKMRAAVEEDTYASGGPLNTPDAEHPANLISSLCADGKHRPALDIDIPMVVVPSSTPGHCHVYFPGVELEWWQYAGLLSAFAAAGIIDPKYAEHSIERGQTLLRPPGVAKATTEEYEAARALRLAGG